MFVIKYILKIKIEVNVVFINKEFCKGLGGLCFWICV